MLHVEEDQAESHVKGNDDVVHDGEVARVAYSTLEVHFLLLSGFSTQISHVGLILDHKSLLFVVDGEDQPDLETQDDGGEQVDVVNLGLEEVPDVDPDSILEVIHKARRIYVGCFELPSLGDGRFVQLLLRGLSLVVVDDGITFLLHLIHFVGVG